MIYIDMNEILVKWIQIYTNPLTLSSSKKKINTLCRRSSHNGWFRGYFTEKSIHII